MVAAVCQHGCADRMKNEIFLSIGGVFLVFKMFMVFIAVSIFVFTATLLFTIVVTSAAHFHSLSSLRCGCSFIRDAQLQSIFRAQPAATQARKS